VVTADLDVKNRKSTEHDDDDVPKPIWETSWANWETGSATGPHTAFIAIQQFLKAAQRSKQRSSHGLAIVVVGWQGDDLLDSLIRRVKRDIVRWDGHARINAVLLPGRDRRCDLCGILPGLIVMKKLEVMLTNCGCSGYLGRRMKLHEQSRSSHLIVLLVVFPVSSCRWAIFQLPRRPAPE
jgi:hypothetical protein